MFIKPLLLKLFGTSYTAITSAWNFRDWRVDASAAISLIVSSALTWVELNTKHFLGISGMMLLMIVTIITVDFVTGISYAFKLESAFKRKFKGKPSDYKFQVVCSAKGIRSAYKLGVYIAFLFCTNALIREYQGIWVSSIIKYIHIYITIHIFFWESFSVDENLKKLNIDLGLRTFMANILSLIQKKVEDNIPDSKE